MNRINMILLALLALACATPSIAQNNVTVRIKDITHLKNEVGQMAEGTGLVTGLNGTGDDTNPGTIALNRNYQQGIRPRKDARDEDFKSTAVGMVRVSIRIGKDHNTATGGLRAEVTTLDGTSSLVDGSLVKTELVFAGSKKVILTAGGQLEVDPEKPTRGWVECTLIDDLGIKQYAEETDINGNKRKYITFVLDNGDTATQTEIINSINELATRLGETGTDVPEGEEIADADDIAFEAGGKTAVKVYVPKRYENNISGFIAEIHRIEVDSDIAATIVIDHKNNQVVWNGNVRISKGTAKVGNVLITVPATGIVPGRPLPGDEVKDPAIKIGAGQPSTTMQEFMDALNAMGLDAAATGALFKNMEEVGILHGKIVEKN